MYVIGVEGSLRVVTLWQDTTKDQAVVQVGAEVKVQEKMRMKKDLRTL